MGANVFMLAQVLQMRRLAQDILLGIQIPPKALRTQLQLFMSISSSPSLHRALERCMRGITATTTRTISAISKLLSASSRSPTKCTLFVRAATTYCIWTLDKLPSLVTLSHWTPQNTLRYNKETEWEPVSSETET